MRGCSNGDLEVELWGCLANNFRRRDHVLRAASGMRHGRFQSEAQVYAYKILNERLDSYSNTLIPFVANGSTNF
jgi:hypothetical protein